MQATALVLSEPERLEMRSVALSACTDADVVVDIEWTGISTGTERLLWSGRMPPFPGMGYPLIPGYESVGRIVSAGSQSGAVEGERVFVPGARCFKDVRGLFGGAASRVIVPGAKVVTVDPDLGEQSILLALAATAQHAIAAGENQPPDLIVGHGVLGRLLARLVVLGDAPPPVVWERHPDRCTGAAGYTVVDPASDTRRDYRHIYDVSGDAGLLDELIGRLAPGGTIVLAGFYSAPISFAFPPAFMREARLRIAAEWRPEDLAAVNQLVASRALSLGGLITHRAAVADAPAAYRTAFDDPHCLKMILDWRSHA